MAFTRMKFAPENGLKNKETFLATPVSEDAAREQFQRLLDQIKEQVNALMAALENKSDDVSGAHQIGSAAVGQLAINGVIAKTIWTQLAALNQKIDDAISGGLSISEIIGDNDIVSSMIFDGAVTESKLAAASVSESKLQSKAVTTDKLGEVCALTLKNRTDLGEGKYDTLSYENAALKLKVEGCENVQLCPVVFGTAASPSAGTYPAGTIYIQYVE